jgi:hypothetical protein
MKYLQMQREDVKRFQQKREQCLGAGHGCGLVEFRRDWRPVVVLAIGG